MTTTAPRASPTDPGGHPHRRRGVLVAVEGGEGAGKSVLVAGLVAHARRLGVEVLATREPGATTAGARLRELLLDPTSAGLDARAEALLYAADRAEHAARVLRPALADGQLVLCDRYVDSSIAYQGVARGLGADRVRELSAWATGGLVADLTVVLDIDPALGLARAAGRAAATGGTADRLEAEPDAFHLRVRQAFLDLAAADPDRYLVLDAAAPPDRLVAAAAARLGVSVGAPVRAPAAAPGQPT